MKEFAILTNFCEALTPFAERGDVDSGRESNNIELFSVLTLRDIMLGLPRDLKVYLYHSSSLPILDAMESPFNLYMKNAKYSSGEFINHIMSMGLACQSSLYTCEKIIASTEPIPHLKMYEISPMMMSKESFNNLKNINYKNVITFISTTLKTMIYLCNDNNKLLNNIKEFLRIRYDQLYNKINVNKYTPRYYVNDILLKSVYRSTPEIVRYEVKCNFDETLPQYNPNTLLTMYWDTKCLYVFCSECVQHLINVYRSLHTTSDKLKELYDMINYNYSKRFATYGNYKIFNTVQAFSFRNFQFDVTNNILVKDHHRYAETFRTYNYLVGSYAYSDNINNLNDNHPIVKFNNVCLMDYISNLIKFNNELKEVINNDRKSRDSSQT